MVRLRQNFRADPFYAGEHRSEHHARLQSKGNWNRAHHDGAYYRTEEHAKENQNRHMAQLEPLGKAVVSECDIAHHVRATHPVRTALRSM